MARIAFVVAALLALQGCSMDPVTMVVTIASPEVKSKPWCHFDAHHGCPFDELGHTPWPGTYMRLTECPVGSAQLVCPPLRDTFSPAESDPDRATIYFFRESYAFAAVSPYVFANDLRLSDLAPGGYFVYYALPGLLQLSTKTETYPTKPLTIDVKAGEVHYVYGYYHHNENLPPGWRDWFQLEELGKERGAQVIKSCRLIPADRGE
jgi:hypothetical protein